MAELTRRCTSFFLYDGSKVRGEGDATRQGICYFYPEETALEKQELLCGQLAGVGRCVSELSSSPVRVLRLRRSTYAVRMKEHFFWALSCSPEVPTVSVCQLLDQLIGLFRFYNGPIRRSYQVNSGPTLAARWGRYLAHLQSGGSELHRIFSCLRTIDSNNVDPLLLLKAALILQACQRCPLVLAGCILFRGRVVSTQMSPEVTVKVTVHECETYLMSKRLSGSDPSSSAAVSSIGVFLTVPELQDLRSAPVDKDLSSPSAPRRAAPQRKTRLSRTLSEMAAAESEASDPAPSRSPQNPSVGTGQSESDGSGSAADPLHLQPRSPEPRSSASDEAAEETQDDSFYQSFQSGRGADGRVRDEDGGSASEEDASLVNGRGDEEPAEGGGGRRDPPPLDGPEESTLIPVTLYLHRVKGLVLALLVDPDFLSDTASMEEVYHSSLASLNGLEAHLRTVPPGAPATPGPYTFAHYDCVQSTMTTNLSGRAGGGALEGGAPEHPFVRATSLLHSHFSNTKTLQEAIIRSAGAAVYGVRSVAQETFFQQRGASLRNSGIPNHQDSAFALPSRARHRLLKHGVNLL